MVGEDLIAVPSLVAAVDDPVSAVRIAAIETLAPIGRSARKSGSGDETVHAATMTLVRCLRDQDSAVRFAAFETLGSIGAGLVDSGSGRESVHATATALFGILKDPEPGVRRAAAASLGRIASAKLAFTANSPVDRKAVMDALEEMLRDRDAGVRRAVVNAMAARPKGSDPPQILADGIKDESAENRVAAIRQLADFQRGLDPWVPILLQLAEQDPDSSVRESSFGTLNQAFIQRAVTEAVIPVLTERLSSKNPMIRSEVVTYLTGLGLPNGGGIPKLLLILNEPIDAKVLSDQDGPSIFDSGCAAALALGSTSPSAPEMKEVITALVEVNAFRPPLRRGWAAVALGHLGAAAEEAVPALITLMSNATPPDKFRHAVSAAEALGWIGRQTASADRAVAALLAVLGSSEGLTKVAVITALRQIGPKAADAIPKIRALRNDPDAQVADAAAMALIAIENKGGR